jgi:hypothetical protein
MADLPDDMQIEVAVAEQPVGVFVTLQVVIGAVANHDRVNKSEFTIVCEYPSGTYIRPRTATRARLAPAAGCCHDEEATSDRRAAEVNSRADNDSPRLSTGQPRLPVVLP